MQFFCVFFPLDIALHHLFRFILILLFSHQPLRILKLVSLIFPWPFVGHVLHSLLSTTSPFRPFLTIDSSAVLLFTQQTWLYHYLIVAIFGVQQTGMYPCILPMKIFIRILSQVFIQDAPDIFERTAGQQFYKGDLDIGS